MNKVITAALIEAGFVAYDSATRTGFEVKGAGKAASYTVTFYNGADRGKSGHQADYAAEVLARNGFKVRHAAGVFFLSASKA